MRGGLNEGPLRYERLSAPTWAKRAAVPTIKNAIVEKPSPKGAVPVVIDTAYKRRMRERMTAAGKRRLRRSGADRPFNR